MTPPSFTPAASPTKLTFTFAVTSFDISTAKSQHVRNHFLADRLDNQLQSHFAYFHLHLMK